VARGGSGLNAALWYLSRGSGAVALVLLSATVVLGIVDQRRWHSERWPRFALHSVHRFVGLFAVSFLSIHILSVVVDGFVQIRLVDALIPFGGSYRPLWLGFGALAFDLLLAVAITSLLRRRIGQRNWRAIHWLAYAAWPVALMHGLGTGSDVKSYWMLVLVGLCVAAVWMAVFVRVSAALPRPRLAGMGALGAAPLALMIWLPIGPLAHGWAKRAGTPSQRVAASSGGTSTRTHHKARFAVPLSADVNGKVRQGQDAGFATVDLAMRLSGHAHGAADVLLEGEPLDGGGVSVRQSRVSFGPASDPNRYSGSVVALDGGRVVADVHNGHGDTVRLNFRLNVSGDSVSGTLDAASA
jgi:ferric reductase like protein